MIGQPSLVALDQGTARAYRQLETVGSLSQQRRIGEGGARLEYGHGPAGIGGKPLGDNRSGAAGTDDQHIAVRGGRGQGGG